MIKLTKNDKKILQILNNNARASVSEISRKTGIPRDSVNYRINRLIKSKVISFFHTVIDPIQLGHPIFSYVNITLNNFDQEEKLYSFMKSHPNIVYVAKTTGKWDCIIAISAKSLEDFDNVLKEVRTKFSGIIKDYEAASIIKQYKYDYMVDLIE